MAQGQSSAEFSADAGGQVEDFGALLQQAHQNLDSTRGELTQTRQELEQLRGQSTAANQTLQRLQQALSGEDKAAKQVVDRVPGLRAQLDEYLQAAIDNERRGTPMPLTTNMAVQLFEHLIGYEGDKAAQRRELAEIKKKLERHSDPMEQQTQAALYDLDGKVMTALNTIYGPGDEYNDIKGAQYNAITEVIGRQLSKLQREDPATFDQIIRQPNARANLVRMQVERAIPPRARAVLEQDAVERHDASMEELMEALRNARSLAEERPDMQGIIEDLKAEIHEKWWMAQKGSGVQARLRQAAGGR